MLSYTIGRQKCIWELLFEPQRMKLMSEMVAGLPSLNGVFGLELLWVGSISDEPQQWQKDDGDDVMGSTVREKWIPVIVVVLSDFLLSASLLPFFSQSLVPIFSLESLNLSFLNLYFSTSLFLSLWFFDSWSLSLYFFQSILPHLCSLILYSLLPLSFWSGVWNVCLLC